MANHLTIERLGGLAGFGAPSSNVRGRGRVDLDLLSAEDRVTVEALFSRYRATPRTPAPDAFRYKISRGNEAVEVPEGVLPSAVTSAVTDELI